MNMQNQHAQALALMAVKLLRALDRKAWRAHKAQLARRQRCPRRAK